MSKFLILFICILLINCDISSNSIIIKRTAHELIEEFKNDGENANKYYTGKRIEVSGIPVYEYREVIVFGENPAGELSLMEYENENITIECEFNTMVYSFYINSDEEITILGKYKRFINYPNIRSITLINCTIVSREIGK